MNLGSPPLSKEEQLEYIKRAREGDEKAKERLVTSCYGIVKKVASTMSGFGIPMEDMIQEGFLGIINAIDTFDINGSGRFSTYAQTAAKNAIIDAICTYGKPIREPSYLGMALIKVEKMENRFRCKYGRDPTVEEISIDTGISEKVIERSLETRNKFFSNKFFSDTADLVHTSTLSDLAERISATLDEKLRSVLAEIEYEVVTRVFGFNGNPESPEEIAESKGMSPQYIRKVQQNAIDKLRRIQWTETA